MPSQYLGNNNKMEVHDLSKETRNCQIDEIRAAGHAVDFPPGTSLDDIHSQGYDNCHWCLGRSRR